MAHTLECGNGSRGSAMDFPALPRENPSVFREEFYGFLYQYGNVIL